MKKSNKQKKDNWLWQVFIVTFLLAMGFGAISNTVVNKLNIYIATILLFIIIGIGIVFDLVGMAVASAVEAPFHAKAAKKHKGAKESIRLVRNAPMVSNICNDVIGDICGIISGSIGALLSVSISSKLNLDIIVVSLLISAIIASITVGGKALGKKFAINKCTNIIYIAGTIIHYIWPVKQNNKKG
ncbi:MAG: hypothetical protein E7166_01200 [Firmicutes bacterium]|nr:hypothetical protein [Bacillota bacterium]